jgi:hypothetical protein
MAKAGVGEKAKCPHCHKEFAVNYMSSHWRRTHNIYGGKSGRPKNALRTKVATHSIAPTDAAFIERVHDLPEVSRPRNQKQSFKVMPFVVLEDQDGGLWVAEKMK